MEASSLHFVRESNRNFLKLNRRVHRNEDSDIQRCIGEPSISPQSVIDVAEKLKTKSPITAAELNTLKNGLMEDPKHIDVVLGTHGSLRGLVRELSGHNIKNKYAAAGCCCNLGLGDTRGCAAVAKSAGPYLIATLDSLSTELAITCAWTLGNLAGSGGKVCNILAAQGALTKLCELLTLNNGDVQEAALYALQHFAYQMGDEFRSEHLKKILLTISKIDVTVTSSQLSFILSCHSEFTDNLPNEFLPKMLSAFETSLQFHTSKCDNNCHCVLLNVTRTLANMELEVYADVLNYLLSKNMGGVLWNILCKDSGAICDSLLWFLGNLYNHFADSVFFINLPIPVQ